jgi:uncharacterized membrane protein
MNKSKWLVVVILVLAALLVAAAVGVTHYLASTVVLPA